MPTEKNQYVSSTPGKNTLKNHFIIYADLECLLYPISTCDNTPNNSFTTKKNVHIPCGFSMLTSYAYDKSLNEHFCHHAKDCLSKFSKTLKAQVNKIINIEQKIKKTSHMQMQIYALYVKNPLVMIKMLLKLGITVTILVNTEVLLTMHAIYSIKYLKVYL